MNENKHRAVSHRIFSKSTRLLSLIVIAIVMIVALSACSAKAGESSEVHPKDVTVDFSTSPQVVHTREATTLIADVKGLKTLEGASLAFDIRKANWKGLPEVVNAQLVDGKYTISKKFEEKGEFFIYIHLYQDELHITKKKQIVVE
ncbi:hypothetical protein PaecuDRAFT_3027 [Paenibacillus curdlanolyticus YK9]|uniref:YtkA-like domain-containing protein n=1 Tax=Paenibacillus curdlanolyticus YK9 TaxID=717606 RepID=E0IBI8_9BACL|nr:hypothetical protein [Paenibacillus curdlanolyticus]EFM10068.1 hypothetical protein PaecuDRAFT_3027 [Paenibacillus curdlanolyticus YK9]